MIMLSAQSKAVAVWRRPSTALTTKRDFALLLQSIVFKHTSKL